MNVVVLATCTTCAGAVALRDAAIREGYVVTMERVTKSDDRTRRSADAGIGLPVIVDEDGALSDDAKTWIPNIKKKRTKVTHPLDEVVDDANNDFII